MVKQYLIYLNFLGIHYTVGTSEFLKSVDQIKKNKRNFLYAKVMLW